MDVDRLSSRSRHGAKRVAELPSRPLLRTHRPYALFKEPAQNLSPTITLDIRLRLYMMPNEN
jgi:hypothetical protein